MGAAAPAPGPWLDAAGETAPVVAGGFGAGKQRAGLTQHGASPAVDGAATGRLLPDLGAVGAAMTGSRLTGAGVDVEPGTVLLVRRQYWESINRRDAGCLVIALEPGDRLVVTEYVRPGTGPGFGRARDANGVETPFRGELVGDVFEIVED